MSNWAMEIIDVPDGHLVKCRGELDVAERDPTVRALGALAVEPGQTVRLDLADVVFIDSAGLHALLEARQQLDRLGARLVVVNPSRAVTRILELAGVEDLLGVGPCPSRGD